MKQKQKVDHFYIANVSHHKYGMLKRKLVKPLDSFPWPQILPLTLTSVKINPIWDS